MKNDPILGWIITYNEWLNLGLTKRRYEYLKNKNNLKTTIPRASKGKPVGIVVSSLPEKYQNIIKQRMVQLQHDHQSLMVDAKLQGEQLAEAAVQVTANTLMVNAPFIVNDLRGYIAKNHGQYIPHYVTHYNLSKSSVIGYAKLCALVSWVYGIATTIRNSFSDDKDYGRQMRSFKANLAEALQYIDGELEVKLPISNRLNEWVDMVLKRLSAGEEVTTVVIPKRCKNTNARIIDVQQQLAIEKLYADPAALSINEIYNKLIEMGRLMGWWRNAAGSYNPPSYETIRRYIVQRKNILKLSRSSLQNFVNSTVPTINRKYPTQKNMVWGIDGTAQNEYVRHKGKVRQYAYAITVYDYATFRLLNTGITLGPNETAEVLIDALKGAIREAGYKPYMLQCDHGPGYNGLKQWCEANGIRVMAAGLGIARAKPVELLIGLKDRLVDRFNASWSGGNRTARGSNSQPGEQYVKDGQRRARDFSVAKANIAREVMEQWNHYVIETREGKPCGKTPTELWNELDSYTPALDNLQLAMLCGVKHTVKLTIDGLTVQHGGQKYLYFPPLETDADLDTAYRVFSEVPRSGHRQGSQLDIYILDYGKPAPVFKGNAYYGMWQLKPRVDMFATITKNTTDYNKLRAFQKLFIEKAKEHISQVESEAAVQPYAPVLDNLKQQPLTGRKRVVPLLDKGALNADEIMSKSGHDDLPDGLEVLESELAETSQTTETSDDVRQYVNVYTGEIITYKKPKKHES